jgi:hypothetical protein
MRPVALITGASSGLGAVFARRLAADHDLILVARRKDKLEALAAELTAQSGAQVSLLVADLAEESGLSFVADRIRTESNLALLVNNAGFGARGLFWESDLETQERMHRLHVMATVRLNHAALRTMVPRNVGGIINVASVAAFAPRAGSASYGSTKSWMTAFTESLHLELASIGSAVQVQALCPGFTITEFHDTLKAERRSLAPSAFWMSADQVVDDSLAALKKRKLIVVPGWRYKIIVAILPRLPERLRLAFGSRRASSR